jgi:HKD family nuclease
LRRTLPCRTVQHIAESANFFLIRSSIDRRSIEASNTTGVDLSIHARFNGIIADQRSDESAWRTAYENDESCNAILRLISNPGDITNESLIKVHNTYRAAIRNSKIKYERQRLILYEPVSHSVNSIRLTIVPLELRKHVFISFHVNPIGGHFSLYYTLHRIRLRFHWPHMYTYIKHNIDDCVACVLRNGGTRASSELLYSFPLSAPYMAVHADAWVPGDTFSFDGFIGLMIVVCHMTGFAAIEPIKEKNSSSFARSVYIILLRYGLANSVITDPDSKFKGEFKEAFETLKIHHHLSARGHHDAILVERFNRFLNAGLRVFNNDRETNRVFVEGAYTLTYAWNSCPVIGTDLSRSLLTVGREFHFPIDFEANRDVSYHTSSNEKKRFASNLTDLLLKSREIYVLLISEHRAAHREYRNAQINNPRKFKLNDIVFTNVQVQSKKSKGTVQKLSYIKRGPYKIVNDYKSGSYELQPTIGKSRATIKKHGSDLYLSPQSLIPHKPILSSDTNFGNLHKKTVPHPYKVIGVEGYEPSQPWAQSAEATQLNLALLENIPTFPTVQEMDNEFDGWPESGNPFINKDAVSPAIPEPVQANISILPNSIRTRATIIADLIRSDDKLFFVAYSQERSQARKEWKLVKIDFKRSLQQHPQCLQDGRFLAEFYIEHYRDKKLDICNRRYWLEYHKSNSHKSLSVEYHILQPSQYSEATAASKHLVPYRAWIHIDDSDQAIHGPFEFATLNNRKTRDRVSEQDWLILGGKSALYDNEAPRISERVMQVDITQPIYEQVRGNQEVEDRLLVFMMNMEYNDDTLKDYGS